MLGYARPVSPSFTLRGDVATIGQIHEARTEQGIPYSATLKANRGGLFADWFVAGGLRLTGGLTFNQMKIELRASGNGGSMTIGDTTFSTSPNDHFDVDIKFPSTTPYLGVGYGHHGVGGLGIVLDVGASLGRATLTESHGGPNLSNASQADVDKELAQLREGVGKVRFVPQVSLGVNYRF
jgi:hypothetical protein